MRRLYILTFMNFYPFSGSGNASNKVPFLPKPLCGSHIDLFSRIINNTSLVIAKQNSISLNEMVNSDKTCLSDDFGFFFWGHYLTKFRCQKEAKITCRSFFENSNRRCQFIPFVKTTSITFPIFGLNITCNIHFYSFFKITTLS